MARLASQVRGGYYAAAPEAISAILAKLHGPIDGECLVLDPCAGEGLALNQIATCLRAVPYGCELSEDRARTMAESVPAENTLAPADFLRTAISYHSFSFVWCNPPYDYSTSGGRTETEFARRSTDLLVDGGVLALVCPQNIAEDDYEILNLFQSRFERVSVVPFPEEVRKYNEVVVLGQKRKKEIELDYRRDWQWFTKAIEENFTYDLPPGVHPKTFRKKEPTDAEVIRLVAKSPLRFQLDPPADGICKLRPPLPPGIGHRAMLLASGHIDGLICPPDEPPHVIRGTATKIKYTASCEVSEGSDGEITTRTVISEKPRLVIRVLTSTGKIVTLANCEEETDGDEREDGDGDPQG
jgi:hypothetical protein